MVKIILKSGKDEAARRFHPWIFSGAVKKIYGTPAEGDMVEVFDNKDNFLGSGHYQDGSIAVRIVSFEQTNFDYNFWLKKIQDAYTYRQNCGIINNQDFNVYRLIHAESDGLPGLIVDFYNGHAVIQAHSIGMHRQIQVFSQALKEIYGEELKSVYDKSNDTLPRFYETQNSFIYQRIDKCIVSEYGHHFNIDFIEGQKTGFFIDQRENRRLLNHYVKGKNVLNTFCYSGGFSIYALKAGAALVHSVDSSKKAIQLTEDNILLNEMQGLNHKSFVSDTLDFIKNTEEKYDVIILDPPAYAKHREVKHNAVQGYKRLNAEAIEKINSGGILFTFSCSQVVDMNLFKSTVIAAAIKTGRKTRIIHQLTQAPDHPVNAFHPESEYLKGLVLYIE
ncbi:MAG: class I SAM-dependent rRNA methyltransferase [Bacteroidales bacterium]|nr:class I SAM-dependent rRNA methyltransferase [Bacteroidales bacterium]